MCDIDTFGLPAGILGPHPEEFYGAIGRVVCVAAVLEDKVTTLRHTLAGAQQGEFTHEPVGQQIKAASVLAAGLPQPAAEAVRKFLDSSRAAFSERNRLVHSSFPAQPDGRLWGHRPTRDRSVIDATADPVDTSLDDLGEVIGQLAALVTPFNGVHGLASVAHRR